jgi:hypothetical protein
VNFCLDPLPEDRFLCHLGGGGGGGAGTPGNIYQPAAQPGMDQNWQDIFGSLFHQFQGGQSPGQMAYPQVQQAAQGAINNPYQGQTYGAAQDAFTQMIPQYLLPNATTGAGVLQGMAGLAGGQAGNVLAAASNPAYAQAGQMGSEMGQRLFGEGTSILNEGFDPQGALFNRTQNQVVDQANATNSMYGLGASPYGASTAANALGNFDINWQNNRLGRMAQAGQSAGSLFGQGLSDTLTPANNAMAAQATGAGALSHLAGIENQGYAGAENLLTSGINAYTQAGAAPYSAFNTVQGNDMSALQNLVTLGNSQYILPEQLINNANSYLRLGQSANDSAANLGMAQNAQMMSGLGGLGQLAGANGPFGSGGMFGGMGGLFGGGAPMFDAATMGSIADVAGGGMGAATVGGGGDVASSLLPMMMMGS